MLFSQLEQSGREFIDQISALDVQMLINQHSKTASVVLGGGTPKNFINQASVQAAFYDPSITGHQYAIQIVTDAPHFGGASGSTLDEAQSWGKLSENASRVSVNTDATVALPFLTCALVASSKHTIRHRKKPTFDTGNRHLILNGETLPIDHFRSADPQST